MDGRELFMRAGSCIQREIDCKVQSISVSTHGVCRKTLRDVNRDSGAQLATKIFRQKLYVLWSQIRWLGLNRLINRQRTLRYRGRAARALRLPRSDRLSASASTGERYIDVRPIRGEVFPHRQSYWRKRRCQLARRQTPVVQA